MVYLENKVVAVLVIKTIEGLKQKIENIIENGYSILEVTLRTECAFEAIKIIRNTFPDIKVGAGTITSLEQLERCVEYNVDFGVSPGFNSEIVLAAKKVGFLFIPGIATPSELESAMSIGVELVKVFPAKILGGTDFIKALTGPYHTMRFMPTGGIDEQSSKEYLSLSSVMCVGGTWMTK